jgi:hypothetical protein
MQAAASDRQTPCRRRGAGWPLRERLNSLGMAAYCKPCNRSFAAAALSGRSVFAGSYRAAAARERTGPALLPKSVKHPRCALSLTVPFLTRHNPGCQPSPALVSLFATAAQGSWNAHE